MEYGYCHVMKLMPTTNNISHSLFNKVCHKLYKIPFSCVTIVSVDNLEDILGDMSGWDLFVFSMSVRYLVVTSCIKLRDAFSKTP